MTDKEKLNELYRQLNTSHNNEKKRQLHRAINKIEHKLRKESLGVKSMRNNTYIFE